MSFELNDSLDDLLGVPWAKSVPSRFGRFHLQARRRAVCRELLALPWHRADPVGRLLQVQGRWQADLQNVRDSPWRGCDPARRSEGPDRAGERDAWQAANPAEFAWLNATAPRWDLAMSYLNDLKRFGSLTEKQLAVVHKGIERDAARAAERSQKAAGEALADTAGVDRLKAAFDQAIAYSAAKGLKRSPKITIGDMVISPAKAASKNPGALYVKQSGTYLGKVADGRFFASRECAPAQQAKVMEFIANPKEASEVYGRRPGRAASATPRSQRMEAARHRTNLCRKIRLVTSKGERRPL